MDALNVWMFPCNLYFFAYYKARDIACRMLIDCALHWNKTHICMQVPKLPIVKDKGAHVSNDTYLYYLKTRQVIVSSHSAILLKPGYTLFPAIPIFSLN